MHTIRVFVLRLFVDSERPHDLRGTLRSVPDGETHSFVAEEALLALLRQMTTHINFGPSSLSENPAEAAPTPPVLCCRAWEPGQLHSDKLLAKYSQIEENEPMNIKPISISLVLSLGLLLVLGLVLVSVGQAAPAVPQAELHVCACVYTNVQDAVDAANDGDVIKIAGGVYTETTPLSQMVSITKSLTLRGGYNPPDWTVPDPTLYPTTLDAQGSGRVMYIDGSGITGAITVTLDGLQLTGGQWSTAEYVAYNDVPPGGLTNSWWNDPPGGGVRVQHAHVFILNSRIYANHTFNGIGSGLFQHYGSLTMQNSTIQENSGTGGIYGSGASGGGLFLLQTTISISHSLILSNSAGYSDEVNQATDAYGGGIFLNHSTATIDQTTIQGNAASQYNSGWGGGLYSEFGSVSLSNSTIMSNTAALVYAYYGQQGGGAYLAPYGAGASVLTGNLFQGNAVGGIVAYGQMTITGNTFAGNTFGSNGGGSGGGVTLFGSGVFEDNSVLSNTGDNGGGAVFNGSLTVIDNTFEGNTAAGGGGGLVANGSITLIRNVIQNNTADNCGGGLMTNGLVLEDGDRLLGNTAWYGGGLCVKANSGGASYQNLVILDNVGSVNGSGVYVDRGSASGAVNVYHSTIGRNTGGDGSGVNVNTGAVAFVNTILYSQTVGVQNVNGNPSFNHTLRYQVLTPTVGVVSDLFAITGAPAFTADGYHLTQQSAAIDAGISTPVTDDVDGDVRPQGQAPDLGADESPYTHGGAPGVQVNKQAGTPHWVMQWDPLDNAMSMLLQQDYMIPFSYGGSITSPVISTFTFQDNLPAALQLSYQESVPATTFSQAGNQLTWQSMQPLQPNSSGWIGLVGQSATVQPGVNLSNTASMVYSLAAGQSYTVPLQAGSQVPARPLPPPLLLSPANGEMCLDEQGRLAATGLTIAGMTVHLYENSSLKASTTANTSGVFTITWTSTLSTSNSVNLYVTVCDPAQPGNCSAPSPSVHLDYPLAFWCPQRSYWEGDVHNEHFVFHFVNEQGRYATNDFELPGVYGFQNTLMHLYSCCDRDTNPFTVRADGTVYTTPVQHVGRMWTFNIGAAHDVIVQSQCQVGGTPPSHGRVLIDPDGFVFDITRGGGYDPITGMFSPVQALAGITVTAYVSVPEWGGWIPWPAQFYNDQINPQVTKSDGYFAFFTPPGTYYLQATGAGGYQSWRSPVIEVITQVVHANVPLTPWVAGNVWQVALSSAGPNPAALTVPIGSSVEWLSTLSAAATVADLERLIANPLLRPLSARNPLGDTLSFDGGLLAPGQVYRRQFTTPGTYAYSDGSGHTGQVVVTGSRIYLPLIVRRQPAD
jgi:hypothetical protein